MNDLPANDEIVAIEGKQYSRLMAEEMARDIEMLSVSAPESWSISDNSSLKVRRFGMLSFAEPVLHGYLVDGRVLDEATKDLVSQFGQPTNISSYPDVVRVMLPQWNVSALSVLRPPHEAAIRRAVEAEKRPRSAVWMWHNMARFADLEQVVGRSLPQPAYLEDLLAWREREIDSTELSESQSFPDISKLLLDQIAAGIEAAHTVNAKSWSIYKIKSGIVFSVSGYSAAFVAKERGSWMLLGTPQDEQFDTLSSLRLKTDYAEIPEFLVYADDRRQLEAVAVTYQDEFLAAVRDLATRTKTSTPRTAEFQPHLLDQLAEAVGRSLPRPAYADEARSQKDAEDPGIFDSIDSALLEQMARDIETAHAVNPNSWSLYLPRANELRLSVKNLNSLSINPTHALFVLSGRPNDPRLQSKRPDISEDQAAGTDAYIYDRVSVAEAVALLDEFQDVHISAISWLARGVRTRQQWSHVHDQSVVDALADIVGRALPQPGYWNAVPVTSLAPLSAIRDQFAASGLRYTDAQIATFYTALQTKGFVVLSGISGTGKSKIATGFVEMLPSRVTREVIADPNASLISVIAQPYMIKRRQIIIPKQYRDEFPTMDIGEAYKVDISIGSTNGTGRLWYRQHASGTLLLSLSLHESLKDALGQWSVGDTLVFQVDLNEFADKVDRIYIANANQDIDASLSVSEFETASIEVSNHLFLSVRPDWRDSTSLLGYYNPLTQTYEWTEFLHFLIRAQESYKANDGLAWFVILDEMNLAHVEYYFADLLSVIESGRDSEGWTREPLRLTYPDILDDDVPPHELKLPPNLYIIGTVNMDETTHAFSPKVLDRAFTIELADVDFSNYPIASTDAGAATLTDDEKSALLQAFTREGRFALIDKGEIDQVVAEHPRIRADLQALNALLQPHRMHFGYRVFDEIAQYLHNNDINGMMDFADAFDQAVFMKVLPKFTGSRARLRVPLFAVLAWTFYPANPAPMVKSVTQSFESILNQEYVDIDDFVRDAKFPVVAHRVAHMLVALERDGFVSFG